MAHQSNVRNNNTALDKYQKNSAQDDSLFNDIVNYVESPTFNKTTFRNLLRQFGSSQKAKIFLRCIPHFRIKNKSYRNLSALVGFSHEEIRQWVIRYAPEILNEEGGVK